MDSLALLLATLGLLAGLLLGVAVGSTRARWRAAPDLARLTAERDGLRSARDTLRADRDAAAAQAKLAETRAAGLQATVEHERIRAAEQLQAVRSSSEELTTTFTALSAEALERNSVSFLQLADSRLQEAGARAAGELEARRQAVEHLVGPLGQTLAKVELSLQEMEQRRVGDQAMLGEQIGLLHRTGEHLRIETSALGSALRKPQTRGRWGELQLRRSVELAGMADRCDFVEQPTARTSDGAVRPDLVVRLVGGKSVVVDAKTTLAAFLEAAETTDDRFREDRLAAHARHLRDHVDRLADKSYWRQFAPAPEFVVLFVPGDAFLAPALERDPDLLEHAFSLRVHIATPTTLISLLRAVAYGWQQDALAANAREVFELGRELYGRLGTMGAHLDRLGKVLGSAVGHYNSTVGSLERNVLSQARRLADLQVTDRELASPRVLEESPRGLAAAELLADVEAATPLRILPGRQGPSVEPDGRRASG